MSELSESRASRDRQLVVHHEDPASPLRWRVGDVEVVRVEESVIEMSPRYLLPDLSQELLDSCGEWVSPFFAEEGQMLLSIHSFVVFSGDNTVVVDTCIAEHTQRRLPGDSGFGERLAAAIPGGLDAVDFVVCTHMHFDHVGWNTERVGGEWVPTFPSARYLVSEDELSGTRADDSMEVMESSIDPLVECGVLDAVDSDHRIDDNLCLVPSAGHSPGHVCVMIESAGERALITGDSFHSPVQFALPEISASYADFDSMAAGATRRRLIDRLVDSSTLVLGSHFAPPTSGRVRSGPETAWFDVG
ncbi:MAG: MBL fold metallo-hydrolase [Actinomycetia bacterium]|nr:MBL fold metallo-hydrolase [Actinomycetes bacterium]MCP4958764.1 MBL fold metallo-hydrolase [Actinomycetes bacterium]